MTPFMPCACSLASYRHRSATTVPPPFIVFPGRNPSTCPPVSAVASPTSHQSSLFRRVSQLHTDSYSYRRANRFQRMTPASSTFGLAALSTTASTSKSSHGASLRAPIRSMQPMRLHAPQAATTALRRSTTSPPATVVRFSAACLNPIPRSAV